MSFQDDAIEARSRWNRTTLRRLPERIFAVTVSSSAEGHQSADHVGGTERVAPVTGPGHIRAGRA
jgi:hypothetical protein